MIFTVCHLPCYQIYFYLLTSFCYSYSYLWLILLSGIGYHKIYRMVKIIVYPFTAYNSSFIKCVIKPIYHSQHLLSNSCPATQLDPSCTNQRFVNTTNNITFSTTFFPLFILRMHFYNCWSYLCEWERYILSECS